LYEIGKLQENKEKKCILDQGVGCIHQ